MAIVFGLILIAAFAAVAILVDPADPRDEDFDPRNNLPFWTALGRR